MIRALVLILGLLLGLCGAAVLGGRMAHLRLATAALPAWTEGLDGDAGVLAGQGRIGGAALGWELVGVDRQGPRWRILLSGPDWQARGAMRVAGTGLRVEGLDGVIPASVLVPGAAGMLALNGGLVRIALPAGTLTEAELNATARGLVLEGGRSDGSVLLRYAEGVWAVTP
ncbi:MAG: hypothetical protein KJZ59_10240 [Pararhodobacter sp.]|nr:hypothetical protein [Pararhodobacter sp.]